MERERMLQEQDEAYQISLAADRAKVWPSLTMEYIHMHNIIELHLESMIKSDDLYIEIICINQEVTSYV